MGDFEPLERLLENFLERKNVYESLSNNTPYDKHYSGMWLNFTNMSRLCLETLHYLKELEQRIQQLENNNK